MHFSRIKNYIRLIFGDKRIILLSVLIITAIPFLLFYGKAYNKMSNINGIPERINGEINKDMEAIYWEERMRIIGAKNAHIEFANSMKSLSSNQQHVGAHAFGRAIYKLEMDVFTICDDQFAYGCLHEFITKTIIEKGLKMITTLNDKCLKKQAREALFCQHGIGHAVLSIVGYQPNDLVTALTICKKSIPGGKLNTCFGGAYMEYNLRTTIYKDDEISIRKFTDNIADPCDSLEEYYQASCAFWQTQWWMSVFFRKNTSLPVAYRELGWLCRDFDYKQDNIDACFSGIGHFSGLESNFDLKVGKQLCEFASKTPRERMFCTSFMKKRILDESGQYNDEERCHGLEGIVLESCIKWDSL